MDVPHPVSAAAPLRAAVAARAARRLAVAHLPQGEPHLAHGLAPRPPHLRAAPKGIALRIGRSEANPGLIVSVRKMVSNQRDSGDREGTYLKYSLLVVQRPLHFAPSLHDNVLHDVTVLRAHALRPEKRLDDVMAGGSSRHPRHPLLHAVHPHPDLRVTRHLAPAEGESTWLVIHRVRDSAGLVAAAGDGSTALRRHVALGGSPV